MPVVLIHPFPVLFRYWLLVHVFAEYFELAEVDHLLKYRIARNLAPADIGVLVHLDAKVLRDGEGYISHRNHSPGATRHLSVGSRFMGLPVAPCDTEICANTFLSVCFICPFPNNHNILCPDALSDPRP